MRRRRMWGRTAGGGIAAGGLASGLLVWTAIAAFACTNIMGSLTITPTSGPAGTMISTTASGLKPNATYALHFAKSTSGNCMSFQGVLTIAKITANSSGAWTNAMAMIPGKATMGVHSTCGMELSPVKGNSGTAHDTFTVT